MNVPTISNGAPSTLSTYRNIALELTNNAHSKAVKFFDEKIAKSSEHAVVEVHESQMMNIIKDLLR